MKKYLLLVILLIITFLTKTNAQVSPYSLSPKWMLGYYGGIDFTSGTAVLTNVNPLKSEEMSSAMCDINKNIVVYSNNYRVVGNDNIPIATLLTGSTSSTNGPVIIPNPASPTTQWYLFTGNAEVINSLGGGTASGGINAYLINKVGSSVTATFVSQLATGASVREQLYASADGTGGYWVLSRENVTNGTVGKYNSWHITAGGIGAKVTSNGTFTPSWSTPWQGSVKISKCQTRVAYAGNNVEVHSWDKTTGQAGALLAQTSTGVGAYGCEFSPDGNFLYYTAYLGSNNIYQLNISTGVVTNLGAQANGIGGGSLQLGLDGKIYIATGWHDTRPAFLGLINNPNVAGIGCGYVANGFALGTAGTTTPSVYRGVANQAWINPNLPLIQPSVGASCNIFDFAYQFRTYFNDDITVVANSEIWNFGDGTGNQSGLGATPSHTYAGSSGSFVVTLTVTDATCNQTWTNTITVTLTCSMPVDLLNFKASKYGSDKVILNWATINEDNASHFIIERSYDGLTNFEQIGNAVSAKGLGSNISYYNEIDNSTNITGKNYYRLVQYDKNGASKYYNIVLVDFNDKNNIFITYGDNGSIVLNTNTDDVKTVRVIDVLGREVANYYNNTIQHLEIGNGLTDGTYIVQVISNTKELNLKIIKK